eukprot:UN18478
MHECKQEYAMQRNLHLKNQPIYGSNRPLRPVRSKQPLGLCILQQEGVGIR